MPHQMGDLADTVVPDQQQPAENAQHWLVHGWNISKLLRTILAYQELTGRQRLAKVYNEIPIGAA
jgi:hypothetical protein